VPGMNSSASGWRRCAEASIDPLATCAGVGRLGRMPGTLGTLWGVLLAVLLWGAPQALYLAVTLVGIGLAIVVCEAYERKHGGHDHKEIVIDEVVGFLVAAAFLPATWQAIAAAFVLFRFFDILKPYPISWLDQNMKGGLGTVVDDLAAGLAASVILQVMDQTTTWLR
jgi:phosphatidylglycerophosphatase A